MFRGVAIRVFRFKGLGFGSLGLGVNAGNHMNLKTLKKAQRSESRIHIVSSHTL